MKEIITLLTCMCLSFTTQAQNMELFIGAWETYSVSESGEKTRNVVIFSDGYQVATWFHAETGEFISTNGGAWNLKGDTVTEKVEFDSEKPERVGTEVSFRVYNNGSTMGIVDHPLQWRRIDDSSTGALKGAWLFYGRKKDGKVETRDMDQPRKTMKILSGNRFQWIAYNTATGKFSGTGGGTYSAVNGTYTESIEFFSRDDIRVGADLQFDFELIDRQWHHTGLSSKGDPIYEIWSPRRPDQ